MRRILDTIYFPDDLKALTRSELLQLSDEIREQMIVHLSETGGHVGSNLGIIEATVALHYVFHSPIDKIVFDVSHQCYTHKFLTGRKEAYLDPAQYASVSGFTNPAESEHDLFSIGHTSTAISLATGVAKARDVKGESYNVIAIVGDGALSGGEALEGMNNAAALGSNLIIVINDNDMSIAENHGGIYQNLKLLRETDGKAVIDEEQAAVVRKLFSGYISGLALMNAAEKVGLKLYHGSVGRMLRNRKYLGDGYYPPIIDKETFEQAEAVRISRAKALGRVRELGAKPAGTAPTRFTMAPAKKVSDDPFMQAAYAYSLIESEVETDGGQ